MKLQVQLFVPGPNGIGVLTVDKTVDGIHAALVEVQAAMAPTFIATTDGVTTAPVPLVDRSMLRVQSTDGAQASTVLIAFVRNGAWEPYRYPFFFGAQPTG